MSDEPTKYVLKKPMSRSETAWICDKFFDELFVPVSDLSRENQVVSENLKQQIRDIIDEHGKYCYIAGANGGEYKGRIALSLADKTKMALELIQRTKE